LKEGGERLTTPKNTRSRDRGGLFCDKQSHPKVQNGKHPEIEALGKKKGEHLQGESSRRVIYIGETGISQGNVGTILLTKQG